MSFRTLLVGISSTSVCKSCTFSFCDLCTCAELLVWRVYMLCLKQDCESSDVRVNRLLLLCELNC